MRELPQVLRDRYPCPKGCLPARPWWRETWLEAGPDLRLLGLRRTDGAEIPVSLHTEDNVGWPLRQAAEYDAAHPLPHPGFRVGQVWGEADPIRVYQGVAQDGDRIAFYIRGRPGADPPGEPDFKKVARLLGDGIGYAAVDDLGGAFLLADPCCPWLAPWAPKE